MSSTHQRTLPKQNKQKKKGKKSFFFSWVEVLKNNSVIALRRMTQDEGHLLHKQAAGVNTSVRPVLH